MLFCCVWGNILTDRIENLDVLSFVIKTLLFRLKQSCGGSQPNLEVFPNIKRIFGLFVGFWEEAQVDNFLRDAPYKLLSLSKHLSVVLNGNESSRDGC